MMEKKVSDSPLKMIYIDEPQLCFGYGQTTDNPKDGLFLYGPHSAPKHTPVINIGAIGTQQGLQLLRKWAIRIGGAINIPPPGKTDKAIRLHLSNFPGLEEAFGITMNPADFTQIKINDKQLEEATRTLNQHEAVRKTVDLYINEVAHHDKNEEEKIDIWIFVLPEIIFERCKPKAARAGLDLVHGEFNKKQKERIDLPLFKDVIDQSDEEIFDDVPDFHRQIKARLLQIGYPSQLLRETTLAPEEFLNAAGYPKRKLQEPASVAWNIATGLYYKTQPNPPWKLITAREGVCYLGLVFKLIPNHPEEHVCCAAQMFLNEGDGMVFRGANGPYKTSDYEFHLKHKQAKELILKVINTFIKKHGKPPKEMFIHAKSSFNNEEWDAFTQAVPKETTLIGIRIKTTTGDVKLFRYGDYPVLRGTAMVMNERHAYLWTSGYTPRIDTYIGPETPNPLYISIQRSTGDITPDIKSVLSDILGLTKINYNACNYSDGLPVTIRFADKVGDVLTMGSSQGAERQPLKFYI